MRYLKTTDCDGDDMFIGVRDVTYDRLEERIHLLVKLRGWGFVQEHEVTDTLFDDLEMEIHLSDEGV